MSWAGLSRPIDTARDVDRKRCFDKCKKIERDIALTVLMSIVVFISVLFSVVC